MRKSVEDSINKFVKENMGSNEWICDLRMKLKKQLMEECNYNFDIRTVSNKEIWADVVERLGRENAKL